MGQKLPEQQASDHINSSEEEICNCAVLEIFWVVMLPVVGLGLVQVLPHVPMFTTLFFICCFEHQRLLASAAPDDADVSAFRVVVVTDHI